MNVYLARFRGFYLGGEFLLVDETKRKALNQAKKKLVEIGLSKTSEELTIKDIQQIDTSKRDVIVIDDGDY